ncbi:HPF/RaiA family ribosome-associated protein [Lysobacter arvi]|uniref:HPF/RaiA family ribosome-associated protein n=1 Tax=Lysobacter arvi TaxID=3038776 RepID=A0ABU1CCU1_9GAMM|nr:HPF/RaiA family ribosome-associated protein [Lysobacter arvi]MDR0181985.1 HPF/RaiA family ribosome-associated protein [Lysobacter arvi]
METSISFIGMPPSAALRSDIEAHAHRLLRFAPALQRCEVTVSRHERRHQHGNRYRVRIDASVPGASFVAGRSGDDEQEHEDAYVAVRDAFDALRRQLEDFIRIRRGNVKIHSSARPPG